MPFLFLRPARRSASAAWRPTSTGPVLGLSPDCHWACEKRGAGAIPGGGCRRGKGWEATLNFNGVHTITLCGDASDYFLINVTGDFQFSQSVIQLASGVTASHVLWNFPSTTAYTRNILINKSTTVWTGTILAPNLPKGVSVEYHNPAEFNGAIIANNVTVHSDFNLNTVPFQPSAGYTNVGTVMGQNSLDATQTVTSSDSSSYHGVVGDTALAAGASLTADAPAAAAPVNGGADLPTVPAPITPVSKDANDNLVVNGTDYDDVIVITQDATNANTFKVEITTNGTKTTTTVTGVTGRVIANGLGGNDAITVNGKRNAEVRGGAGNDNILGGDGDDVLLGDEGNDTIDGRKGSDVVGGGLGTDRLTGGDGLDVLIAGELCDLFFTQAMGASGVSSQEEALRRVGDAWAQEKAAYADLADNNADQDVFDEAAETLTGGAGADWFLLGGTDKISDVDLTKLINGMTKDGDKVTRI